MKRFLVVLSLTLLSMSLVEAKQIPYKRPPQEIEELVFTTPTPNPVFNSDISAVMLMYANTSIPIENVPLDGLFLANVHIDPSRYCRLREKGFQYLTLKRIPNGEEIKVNGLPEGGTIKRAVWYPKGDKVLIFYSESDGTYLYSASLEDGKALRVSNRRINTTARKFVIWINDTDFLTTCVVEGGEAPVRTTPTGPIVQESLGKKMRARSVQGLLRDDFDLQNFKYYFSSQLVRISPSGEKEIGKPAIYRTISISPDKEHLIVYRVTEPYSNTATFMDLKSKTTIEDLEGNIEKTVKQRNNLSWRADKPATLTWTVNAKKDVTDYKTSVYEQEAPFTESRRLVVRTTKPFSKIYWCNDDLAVVEEKANDTITIYSFRPGDTSSRNKILSYDRKIMHEHPGNLVMVTNQYGRKVLWSDEKNNELLFNSKGYSLDGPIPELVLYNIEKGKSKVVWKSKAPYHEEIIAVKDPTARIFITSRESFEDPKNFYLCNFKKRSRKAITDFDEPYPLLKGVTRKLMSYKRADGVELKSFVWLPAGYNAKRDGKLPVLLWAYPRGYRSAEAAAYPRTSQYAHLSLPNTASSMLFWLTQGYCVMESMAMPLIPIEGKKRANDTFVKQLVMNAEAAIKALDEAGYGDPNRVAVGGRSYGAFMTANLLSHSKLFKAGIAYSGAYNRSLTPFGFQDEGRHYWAANKIYQNMSPFNYAHKLNGAILLIHGSKDENSGTHTIQSERYYQALRGHKKFVRHVELPLDGHSYIIRENILHSLYEVDMWLNKYVKGIGNNDASDKKE